jgi:hypothetical protein
MCYIEVTFCYFEYVILICVSVMLKNVFFIGLREGTGRGSHRTCTRFYLNQDSQSTRKRIKQMDPIYRLDG